MEFSKDQFKTEPDDLLTTKLAAYDIFPKVGDTVYIDSTGNTNMAAKEKVAFAGRFKIVKDDKDKFTVISLFDVSGDNDPTKERPADYDKYTELEKKEIVIKKADIYRCYFHGFNNLWIMHVAESSDVMPDVEKMVKTKPLDKEDKRKPNIDTFGKSDKKTEPMKKVKLEVPTVKAGKPTMATYFDSKGKVK
jgi:hypothetical protein